MYLAHYGLDLKPFDINPDPRFLWLSETHKEALAALRYGIQESKGFLLLTGEVGTGKTVLIKHLMDLANVEATVATLPDPDLGLIDFYNILADEFNMGRQFREKGEFLIHFKRFLAVGAGDNRKLLLIMDEAQRLKHELLEEIRVLSNLEVPDKKVINIFLVGQNELKNILLEERNRAFRQRISVNYHLEPLTEQETSSYIEHRLNVAGATDKIFTGDAVHQIHSFSKGFPRLINVICDHAMLSGYSGGFTLIGAGTIKECADDLTSSTAPTPPPFDPSPDVESHSAIRQDEKPEIMQRPEAPDKNPFYKLAYIGAFFIILFVLPLLFFHTPVYEIFFGSSSEKKEIALTKGVVKIERGMPEDIIHAGDDSKTSQTHRSPNGQMPGVQSSEDIAAAPIGPSSKPADISTAVISRSAGSGDQLKGEELAEKKFLVYFKKESTELDSRLYETLTKIAELLPLHPDVKIFIEGYSDSYGDYSYNKKISQLRANIVKSFFAGQGIAESRITAIGRGPENPIADNATRAGRSKNRRVEIRLAQ